MTVGLWFILGLNVSIGLLGQILLKGGLLSHPITPGSYLGLFDFLLTWRMALVVACYCLNLMLYVLLLSCVEMGFIFTLQVSLAIVGINVAGILLYREPLSLPKMLGILLIMGGIFLLDRR